MTNAIKLDVPLKVDVTYRPQLAGGKVKNDCGKEILQWQNFPLYAD